MVRTIWGHDQHLPGKKSQMAHTKGSPHDGRWYMGSLFHAGGTSVTVRLGAMVDLLFGTVNGRA